MRWTSEVVRVRWGRDEGGVGLLVGEAFEGEGEEEVGGGVLGGVVEMERVEIVGVMAGERRWRGMLLGLESLVKRCDLPHAVATEGRGCVW